MSDRGGRLVRLRKANRLELLLVAEAQLYLLRCQVARWTRPVGTLLRRAPDAAPAGRAADVQTAAQIGWAVTRAAKYGVFRPQCLVRALAIQRMLDRRGIKGSELRIGIRIEGGGMLAHAWVELCGTVIGDSARYVSTFAPAPNLRLVEL